MSLDAVEVGGVRVVPLLDAVTLSSRSAAEGFPDATDATWAEAFERYPEVFRDGRWSLPVRCFLVRSHGRTILVDTGIGPETAPAFAWSGSVGGLPDELAAAGVEPAEIDIVVITHVHDDHLGWTVAAGTDEPLFPNARYLVHPADWELMATSDDPEDRVAFETCLAPIERSWLLELASDRVELTTEVVVVHAPGHTPGHQVVLIDSGDERAIVSGDLVNHPAQLLQPGLNGLSDFDPALAAATRAAFLDRIDREGRLAFAAHLPDPVGRFAREGDRWCWEAG